MPYRCASVDNGYLPLVRALSSWPPMLTYGSCPYNVSTYSTTEQFPVFPGCQSVLVPSYSPSWGTPRDTYVFRGVTLSSDAYKSGARCLLHIRMLETHVGTISSSRAERLHIRVRIFSARKVRWRRTCLPLVMGYSASLSVVSQLLSVCNPSGFHGW